ncbi:hypothetical protein MRB53_029150 [Persea americana]|uniref:Uncharacterized protein n=1 Tax=Persea americana TaxID=3435 RepID=A0ACC2KHK9_PERAE|nr:hypothetical protein MRB53_029150 [Persea americana]
MMEEIRNDASRMTVADGGDRAREKDNHKTRQAFPYFFRRRRKEKGKSPSKLSRRGWPEMIEETRNEKMNWEQWSIERGYSPSLTRDLEGLKAGASNGFRGISLFCTVLCT